MIVSPALLSDASQFFSMHCSTDDKNALEVQTHDRSVLMICYQLQHFHWDVILTNPRNRHLEQLCPRMKSRTRVLAEQELGGLPVAQRDEQAEEQWLALRRQGALPPRRRQRHRSSRSKFKERGPAEKSGVQCRQ